MTHLRKIFAVLGIAVICAVLVIGTYLPYRKSRAIAAVNKNLGGATTVERFLGVFGEALALRSPYGQEEAVLFVSEQLVKAIGAQGDPRVANAIVAYAEKIFAPLLDGRGSSPAKNLLSLGRIHHAAWMKTGDAAYAKQSEELYLRCLEASPRRPECLYGLFQLYVSADKKEQVRLAGEEILRYWPDERVREALNGSR